MTTQQIIEKVRQEISEQQMREDEAKLPIDTSDAKWKVKDWKARHCKGNQPRNNIRITRIIPIVAGSVPPASFWIQKLQLWIKGELFYEYNINHETYDVLFAHPDFNHQPYRIYKHPKFR